MLALTLTELLDYTDEERAKWRLWFEAHPESVHLRLQPEGRFSTVGALVDHIFLVEARHLARLQRVPVPAASDIAPGIVASLFDYGARVRTELRTYAGSLDDEDSRTGREFAVQSGTFRMTPRKLLLHIGLHETRHWAQIALGIRQAGLDPPGNHDLFYSGALE